MKMPKQSYAAGGAPISLRLSPEALSIAKHIGQHLGGCSLRSTLETTLREIRRLQLNGTFPPDSILAEDFSSVAENLDETASGEK
tara:strand:+ start:227 stop:481 length:255 start_codon:yes stop_codon:yes gene_type:complete